MPLVAATLLVEIADSLSDYGTFDPTGDFLERKFDEAAEEVHKAFSWPFLIAQSTIATTQGNLGLYSVPTDFGGLVPVKGTNKFYAYDQYAVPNPIGDGPQGQKYPIIYDEVGEGIRFFYDPGTGNKTFTYLKAFTGNVSTWPDERWLKKLLTYYTMYYALVVTPDFKEESERYMVLAEELKKRQMRALRQRGTRPDNRTLRDTWGLPAYWHLEGESG